MAFVCFFYTIYNHLISFFSQYKGGKKLLMYNNYYFKPSKYCLIYFIIVNTLVSFFSFFETAIERKRNTIETLGKKKHD